MNFLNFKVGDLIFSNTEFAKEWYGINAMIVTGVRRYCIMFKSSKDGNNYLQHESHFRPATDSEKRRYEGFNKELENIFNEI